MLKGKAIRYYFSGGVLEDELGYPAIIRAVVFANPYRMCKQPLYALGKGMRRGVNRDDLAVYIFDSESLPALNTCESMHLRIRSSNTFCGSCLAEYPFRW